MMRKLQLAAALDQNELDRRWRNMCYTDEQQKAAGQTGPKTGAQHTQLLLDHGMQPRVPLQGRHLETIMDFSQFMQACGRHGYKLMEDYKMKVGDEEKCTHTGDIGDLLFTALDTPPGPPRCTGPLRLVQEARSTHALRQLRRVLLRTGVPGGAGDVSL